MSHFEIAWVFLHFIIVSCLGQYYGGVQNLINEEIGDTEDFEIFNFGSNLASLGFVIHRIYIC